MVVRSVTHCDGAYARSTERKAGRANERASVVSYESMDFEP